MHMLWGSFAVNVAIAAGTAGVTDMVCQGLELSHVRLKEREKRRNAIDADVADAESEAPSCWETCMEIVRFKLNCGRLFRFMMVPGVLCGITSALWYPYLLPKLVPGDNVFLKTLLDLMVYSPIMGTAVFVLNPLMAGHSIEYIRDKVTMDFFPCAALQIALWVPFDIMSFLFIPKNIQPISVKIAELAAFLLLSFYLNREPGAHMFIHHNEEEPSNVTSPKDINSPQCTSTVAPASEGEQQ